MENRPIPRAGEFYMHFKGKLYQIITVASHTETEEELVIYQALYGTYKTYARPLEMFLTEQKADAKPAYEETSENVQKITQEEEEAQENNIEPLLKFLDASDLNERLNILVQYKDQITETMLESMGSNGLCVNWKDIGRTVLRT